MPRDEFSPASVPGVWLACVLTALLFPVALIACAGDEPDTPDDVLSDLNSEYTEPIVEAKTSVLCEFIDPGTDNPDCAALVATIEAINPAIDRAIVRLRDISAGGNPWEVEGLALTNDMIAALVARDQADELLIDGWKNTDVNTWREGWTLQREAGDMWLRVIEDASRFLQESESPSASE